MLTPFKQVVKDARSSLSDANSSPETLGSGELKIEKAQ